MKYIKKSSAIVAAATLFFGISLMASQPNIIFVLTDDLGWGDVGVLFQHRRAEANVRSDPWQMTPNLDRLAAEGAALPNHYCSAPVCAPSRASILSGLSQGHCNVRDNQFDKALADNHTLATVLKQAGYATLAVGKWGLQGNECGQDSPATWPGFPTKRGFDHFFGYARHTDGHEHYPKELTYHGGIATKEVWQDNQDITPVLDKCYTADLWTAWTKHWIVEHERTNAAQPFFIYLAYDTPHAVQELPTQAYPEGGGLHGGLQWLGTPHHMISTASGEVDTWIHPDYRNATYDDDHNPATPEVPWPDIYKRYATAVRRVDSAVGDIRQLLQDLHIDRDTLVVFTSDNGPSDESYVPHEPMRADFFDSFGPFDGIKRDCWEGGERVPTLACWPDHIPAGRTVTQASISYEWLRTFADVAGIAAPATADGVSLLPELTGQGVQADPGYLYVEYYVPGRTPSYPVFTPAHQNRQRSQMQWIRMGDYVGVRYDIKTPRQPFEVYNVTIDPKETNNLAASKPALEQQMQTLCLQARRPNSSAPRPYDRELVPASPAIPVVNGVEWQAFEGHYPWVPDFETLTAVAHGTEKSPDLAKLSRTTEAGLFFTGYLEIPRDGEYTFAIETDTGALLRIHDATVIDADFGYRPGSEVGSSIRLQAGLHAFHLFYTHRQKAHPLLKFYWSGPGIEKEIIPAKAFKRGSPRLSS
jgi:arylsulfatase A-like enzyme